MVGTTRHFSVGLDCGSQNTALAVYCHHRQCAFPVELSGDKTIPSCVAVDDSLGEDSLIVGKRAESRSARKCDGVLCAHRELLYASEPIWASHRCVAFLALIRAINLDWSSSAESTGWFSVVAGG